MKKTLRSIVVTVMVMTLPITSFASGGKKLDLAPTPPLGLTVTQPSVASVSPSNLSKCDGLLDRCEAIRQKYKEVDVKKDELIEFQDKEIKNLRSSKESLLNNPYLYGVLGLVVGGWLVGKAK